MSSANYNLIPNYRPLYLAGQRLYASKGLELFKSDDDANSFDFVAKFPAGLMDNTIAKNNFASRVLRAGYHSILPLADGAIVAILRKTIAYKAPDSNIFKSVLNIKRGTRPLNICQSSSGKLFFGEYFQNNDRDEVHVYSSDNGQDWEIAYSFKAGEIRHVHGIFYDSFRQAMWLLSGDLDQESALWFTNDDFKTLEPVVRGTQQARAVAIIPLKDGLIVPMDTPHQKNYIQHFSLDMGFKNLAELPGSAFHIINANGLYLVSTVAEESKVNKASGATVYASVDLENWQKINDFKEELKVPKIVARVIRYPDIILTPGNYEGKFAYARAQAVKNIDGKMLQWNIGQIKNSLENNLLVERIKK